MSTDTPDHPVDEDTFLRVVRDIWEAAPEFFEVRRPATWRTWFKPNDVASNDLMADGRHPDGSVIVTLSEADYMAATIIGVARQVSNRNRGNSVGYSGGRNAAERVAQVNAVCFEIAVARHFGVEPNLYDLLWRSRDHRARRQGADLRSINVEVRSVRHERNLPWVKHKDLASNPILVVGHVVGREGYQCRILGYNRAQYLWDTARTPSNWSSGTRDNKSDRQVANWRYILRCRCNADTGSALDHRCELAGKEPPKHKPENDQTQPPEAPTIDYLTIADSVRALVENGTLHSEAANALATYLHAAHWPDPTFDRQAFFAKALGDTAFSPAVAQAG